MAGAFSLLYIVGWWCPIDSLWRREGGKGGCVSLLFMRGVSLLFIVWRVGLCPGHLGVSPPLFHGGDFSLLLPCTLYLGSLSFYVLVCGRRGSLCLALSRLLGGESPVSSSLSIQKERVSLLPAQLCNFSLSCTQYMVVGLPLHAVVWGVFHSQYMMGCLSVLYSVYGGGSPTLSI